MTLELIDLVFRFAAGGILGLIAVLIIRDRRTDVVGWLSLAVVASTGAFLLASCSVFYREGLADTALRQAAAIAPALLWMLTLNLKPRFKWQWYVPAGFAALALAGVVRAALNPDGTGQVVLEIVHTAIVLGMLAHGVIYALGRTRNVHSVSFQFAIASAILSSVVIYVDPIGHGFDIPLRTELVASSVTFLLVLGVVAQALSLPRPAVSRPARGQETATRVPSNDVEPVEGHEALRTQSGTRRSV